MLRLTFSNQCFTSLPICEMQNDMHGLHVDRVKEDYTQAKQKASDGDGLQLWGAHPEGHVPHYSYLERSLVMPACSPLCFPPAAGQGGREKSLTWPPVKWACREPLETGGGTSTEEGETHASQSAMKCNLAPIGLGLQGVSIDLSLHNNREEGMSGGWGTQGVLRGLWVRGHSTSQGVLLM